MLLAGISYQVGNFWWAVVAGVAAVLVLFIEGWRFKNELADKRARKQAHRERSRQIEQLFTIEHQPDPDSSLSEFRASVADQPQDARVTLRLAAETTVEFVAFRFAGEGTPPNIQGFFDWQRADRVCPEDVVPPYALVDGRWYWRYVSPWRRSLGARITIGVNFIGDESFEGTLVVSMTTGDGTRDRQLPFFVDLSTSSS